jgi:C1A family cysteine protease
MSYSDFTLAKVIKEFGLKITDNYRMYSDIHEVEPSNLLRQTIEENTPLATASNTEKARSEMIISPILIEVRKQQNNQISLFSGIDFSVDNERGLNGNCDFIISRSPELFILTAPVIIIVEAKKENINGGLGQCVAEMLAARIFNERENNEVSTIYGTVTSGTNWRFLKLQSDIVTIDLDEYYLSDIKKILGILASSIRD